MRKLFIVLTLFGASILNAQQLNVAYETVTRTMPKPEMDGSNATQYLHS